MKIHLVYLFKGRYIRSEIIIQSLNGKLTAVNRAEKDRF